MMPFRLIAVVVPLIMSLLMTTTSAQESSSGTPEMLTKPWKDAVARYQKAQESAKAITVKLLDTAEEKARASGDLDKIKAIKEERTLFVESGVVPTSVKVVSFEKLMDAAKNQLRATAQKTKQALVKQKFDDEAAAIDQELADVIGTGASAPAKASVTLKAPDGRIYWQQKGGDKGNQFRMIKPRQWVETTGDGKRDQYHWIEIARTPDYVELHDEDRKFGMRLRAGNAEIAYKYEVNSKNGFGGWTDGEWIVDPPSLVYLSDLPETRFKVWHYLGNQEFGWGKNGQLFDEGKTSLIYLENRPSPHGLVTVPPSEDVAFVKYDIAKLRRQVFRTKFGVADLRKRDPSSPLTFVVLGDGRELFRSKKITHWGVATACEVDVTGVKELELRVECSGHAALAYAVWYEPCLLNK